VIADIANWWWVRAQKRLDLSIDGLGNLRRWMKAIHAQRRSARVRTCGCSRASSVTILTIYPPIACLIKSRAAAAQ
jgi:hypothetical protein